MGFWPKGYKCCVNLSLDYDSDSATIWRTPLDIVNQSRGRFAPNVALPHLLRNGDLVKTSWGHYQAVEKIAEIPRE